MVESSRDLRTHTDNTLSSYLFDVDAGTSRSGLSIEMRLFVCLSIGIMSLIQLGGESQRYKRSTYIRIVYWILYLTGSQYNVHSTRVM